MAPTSPESWLPQASARDTEGPGSAPERGSAEPDPDTGPAPKPDTAEPAAPSIGPKTQIDHAPPKERLAGREHSTEDAMGLDKRRRVTGGTYGPTRTRVIMRFVVFFAVVGALFVGLLFLVDQLDQPAETNADKAPWSGTEREPKPLQ
jgi:hypothetical protein